MKVNKYRYNASADDFQKIPGSPIAYWASKSVIRAFEKGVRLKTIGDTRQGMATSDNNRFLRLWYEVDCRKTFLKAENKQSTISSSSKWFPYNKGGEFRKWYGNSEYLINWENDGEEVIGYAASLYGSPTRTIKSLSEYFKKCISWSKISSGNLAMRFYPKGYIFDVAGCCIFTDKEQDLEVLLLFTNSNISRLLLKVLSPTLNFEAGQIASLPILRNIISSEHNFSKLLITNEKADWDSYETSWDFTSLPLLDASYRGVTLASTYSNLRAHWNEMTLEMQRLEQENNRIFIEAYGLEDELTPDVPLKEITLTCNPYYRYGDNKSDSELEELLLADTMKELISYAVGCMFGRYSLDKPGLILANQGETYSDYCRLVPNSSFPADEDNAIPVLDGDWFSDDIVSRFRKFLRVAFDEEKY
ncbi:MAG: class I SAM-dependent DNA methyltransferase, partial [Spirochaetia bacterium]|nr:class I SAM-dependent DNA methyltransferase [Spirochaetia bacterium]